MVAILRNSSTQPQPQPQPQSQSQSQIPTNIVGVLVDCLVAAFAPAPKLPPEYSIDSLATPLEQSTDLRKIKTYDFDALANPPEISTTERRGGSSSSKSSSSKSSSSKSSSSKSSSSSKNYSKKGKKGKNGIKKPKISSSDLSDIAICCGCGTDSEDETPFVRKLQTNLRGNVASDN